MPEGDEFQAERDALRTEQARTGQRAKPGAAQRAAKAPVSESVPARVEVVQGTQQSVATNYSPIGFMTVVGMAVILAVLSIVVGHWSTGVFMALLLFVLLGALWPPIAFLALGAAIAVQLFVHGPEVFAKSNQLVGGSNP